MNILIEGLQGSGKTTLVQHLHERNRDYTPVLEGDYSPIELSWCAYVNEETYRNILQKYAQIRSQIEEKTVVEGSMRIICYTKIRTDIPGFYQDLEQYEIYNGRRSFKDFRSIILERYRLWQDDRKIYECSLLQNTVEDLILFRQKSDEEILRFYEEIRKALEGKAYHIYYLESKDIRANIETVKRERVDDQGAEKWFEMVCLFFNSSPYAAAHGLKDLDGFVTHLTHRQELELKICREIFPERTTFLTSKNTGTINLP